MLICTESKYEKLIDEDDQGIMHWVWHVKKEINVYGEVREWHRYLNPALGQIVSEIEEDFV